SAAGGEARAHRGRHFAFEHIERLPPPAQPGGPPLWLAGADAPTVLRRVARHFDGWLPYLPTADAYAAGWEQIRREAEAAGRDPNAITPALYVTVNVNA